MKQKYQGVLTINGYPLKLYHCTTAEVKKFLPFTYFTSKSAMHYASVNRSSTDSVQGKGSNALKLGNTNKPYLIPAYLYVSHPKKLTFPIVATLKDLENSFVKELLYEQFGKGLSSYISCQENVFKKERSRITKDIFSFFRYKKDYDFIFQNPYQITQKMVLNELNAETIFSSYIKSEEDNLNRDYLVMQRLIRFWEQKGYDGFSYNNGISNEFLTFRPQQIKRLDRDLTDWNLIFPTSKNEEYLRKIYNETISNHNQPNLSLRELVEWEKCLMTILNFNKQLQTKNLQKQSYLHLVSKNTNQRG